MAPVSTTIGIVTAEAPQKLFIRRPVGTKRNRARVFIYYGIPFFLSPLGKRLALFAFTTKTLHIFLVCSTVWRTESYRAKYLVENAVPLFPSSLLRRPRSAVLASIKKI